MVSEHGNGTWQPPRVAGLIVTSSAGARKWALSLSLFLSLLYPRPPRGAGAGVAASRRAGG